VVRGVKDVLLGPGVGILLMIILCYAAGRLHQWYRSGMDREDAYRDGYNQATKSLFGLATRLVRHQATPRQVTRGTASVHQSATMTQTDLIPPRSTVTSIEMAASARHRAEDMERTRKLESLRPAPRPRTRTWPDDFTNRRSA
jgi:hypothetical protein